MARKLFVLGGTGFVGAETIREAIARGWDVAALARSGESAARLRALGAEPVRGDAAAPAEWSDALRGADAVIDLTQPPLPARIRPRDIDAVSRTRQAMTRALLAALAAIPAGERPLLVSVSGTDDLAPDAGGRIHGRSPVTARPVGFGHVGVPVRRLVEASRTPAAFVHLGTVYGPGKSFAAALFPALARGRLLLPRPARNRLPLVHVRDAARALVHLAGLGRERAAGRTWLVVDASGGTTLGAFFDEAAARLGVAPPRRIPGAILSPLVGRTLLETLTRDVVADPSDLLATGFSLEYPTYRDGLAPTLAALGYPLPEPRPAARRRPWWPWLVAAALAAIVAVNTLDLPLTVPRLRALAGGETLLDLRLGYAPATARRVLDALGGAGRAAYLRMLWTVDLVLPALFAAALRSAIGAGALRRWRGVALAAAGVDYLENAAITALVLAYPEPRGGLALLASAATAAKLALYAAAVALAGAGAVLAWRRGRRASVAALSHRAAAGAPR